ncbi:phage/plasmid primase, P4 family [Microbacterium sp. NPDC089320]|uniref:DNA primase family protein n=1 Tax=Microbacterium sp. NPDC089320 TaxID=3155182 RepID=UPI00342D3196
MATTDADIARTLAQAWADEYANTESGWLRQENGIWRPLPREALLAAVSDWICSNVQSPDPREIHMLRSAKKAQAVLSLLSGKLAVPLATFDAEGDLLNCPNGVVDLRTGAVRPHQPGDRFTKQTAVNFDPDVDRTKWERALEAVPEDSREWAQLEFGVSLFGRQSPHPRITILKGGGANAKTTIAYAVRAAVGDYGMRLDPEAISAGARTNPEYHMASLKGVRFLLAEELEDRMLNEAVVKRITDSVEAKGRFPSGRPFDFKLSHDLFISTNASLRIRTHNRGTTRRFAELPFPYTFTAEPVEAHERKKDPAIKAWFEQPRPEVLAWLVEGAVRAYKQPHLLDQSKFPPSVRRSTADWLGSQHLAQEFVTLRLVRDPAGFVHNSELLAEYNRFRQEQGHQVGVTTPTMLDELRETVIADLIPSSVREQPMKGSGRNKGRAVLGLRLIGVNETVEDRIGDF